MAITNRKHIRKILNDLESINRRDVFKYTKGHLSVAQTKKPHTLGELRKSDDNDSRPSKSPGVVPLAWLPPPGNLQPEITGDHPFLNKDFQHGLNAVDFSGVSKAEQFHRFTAKSQNAVKEKQNKAKLQLKKIEQSLCQELDQSQSIVATEKELNVHRYESGQEAFCKIIDQANVFKNILNVIKAEFDSFVIHLMSGDDYQADAIQSQLNNIANSWHLKSLKDLETRSSSLEREIRHLSTENSLLRADIEKHVEEYNAIEHPVLDPSASKCKPPIQLSQAEIVHELRTTIAEKEKQLGGKFALLRENNVPKGQYRTTFNTFKDLQSEVNSLSAGCRMLERKTADFNEEIEMLMRQIEMSEKDARLVSEIIYGTDLNADITEDPFTLIGKIEHGEISLIDWDHIRNEIDSEPWRSYIS